MRRGSRGASGGGSSRKARAGSIWHWGDNGSTKAYVEASPRRRIGVVLFANSENGLQLAPPVVADVMGGASPALAWLKQRGPAPAFGQFVSTLRSSGAAAALSEYRAAKTKRPDDLPIDEATMNRVGYALLRGKKVADAVEVFRQNVADYPDSWNVHDSLGEAYAADGKTDLAIQAYERSLQLNPGQHGRGRSAERSSGPPPAATRRLPAIFLELPGAQN